MNAAIDFELSNRKMPIVEAKINGETQKFVLDSGAPMMVLNSKCGSNTSDSIVTNQAKIIASFAWGGLQLKNQMAMVADLSHLEQELKTPIHGLISSAQFMHYDLLLDYQNYQVTLVDSHGETPACMKNAQVIPITMSHHIPVVPVAIGEKIFYLGLDTGAEWNILGKAHEAYCSQMGLMSDITLDTITRFDPKDSEEQVRLCSLKDITIGQGVRINHMRFAFHNVEIPGFKADGLMGYELFSRQCTLIRYASRELLLQPLG